MIYLSIQTKSLSGKQTAVVVYVCLSVVLCSVVYKTQKQHN